MERKTEEDVVIRTWKMEMGGYRRPKLRWSDVIRKDKKRVEPSVPLLQLLNNEDSNKCGL